jgi:hypothetical protein
MRRREFVIAATLGASAPAIAARTHMETATQPVSRQLRVLAVSAHPADFCSRAGGTLVLPQFSCTVQFEGQGRQTVASDASGPLSRLCAVTAGGAASSECVLPRTRPGWQKASEIK